MSKWKKQSHVVYQCSYHKVSISNSGRSRAKYVEERIRVICEWKDSEIEELGVMKDHVHLERQPARLATIPDVVQYRAE